MTYAYIRFSTTSQDKIQQVQAIKEWSEPRGITIDAVVEDEGVSGGVSYKDRHLQGLVEKMKEGDILVVSEISRLGRSMSDLNMLINVELKPRKVRLVVIKMGLDLDCAHLKAVDEMIFFSLSFAAQVEKEMIVQRTQSAIDARKDAIRTQGGFISKKGLWTKKLGRPKGADTTPAVTAAALSHATDAEKWRKASPLYSAVKREIQRGTSQKEILQIAGELYDENPSLYSSRNGKKLSAATLCRWAKELRFKAR